MREIAVKSRKSKPIRRKSVVKQRTNGKHKIDAASTISAPVSSGLTRILRPQALFRWLGPQLAAITPTYIEQTMIGAMQGSTIQAWSLFDIMLKSWPELLACYRELVESVLRKKIIFEPYCEEDEKPTPAATEKSKLVACALRRMQPDPARDDSNLEGTLRDILDAWFRGVAVSEIVWQTVEDKQVGTITGPKSTFAVDPINYAYATDGSLGLRTDKSKDTGIWPYSSTSLNPQPSQVTPFSRYPNKFLIAMHKASGGSPLGGALLRPLAWWWCAANFSSDWLLNLAQVFGIPFRWASYDPNASPETLSALDAMLQNMGSNGWARFPTPTTLEFVEMGKQGSDHSPQGELLDRADRYARSLILGQTMTGTHGTTGKGGGQAFGTVEEDVKSDRIDAAGKFAAGIINQQLVPSILLLNYGDNDEMPSMKFLEDEVADLTEAQRDKTLADAGLEIGVDYLRKKYDIPEPAEGEDIIGGEKPMPPGFDQFGGSFGQDTGEETDEPPPDEPAKSSAISSAHLGIREASEVARKHGIPEASEYVSKTSHVKIGSQEYDIIYEGKRIGSTSKGWTRLGGGGWVNNFSSETGLQSQGKTFKSLDEARRSAGQQLRQVHIRKAHASESHADATTGTGLPVGDKPGHPFRGNQYTGFGRGDLAGKLLELNAIEDDAVFARELLELVCGDVPGHEFHGNQYVQFAIGDTVDTPHGIGKVRRVDDEYLQVHMEQHEPGYPIRSIPKSSVQKVEQGPEKITKLQTRLKELRRKESEFLTVSRGSRRMGKSEEIRDEIYKIRKQLAALGAPDLTLAEKRKLKLSATKI